MIEPVDWLYDLIRLFYFGEAVYEQYRTRNDPLPTLSRETSRVLFDHRRLIAIAIVWATLILIGVVCLVLIAAKINGQLAVLGMLVLALVAFTGQGVLDAFSIATVTPTLRGQRKVKMWTSFLLVSSIFGPLCLWPMFRHFRNSMVTRLGVPSLLDGSKSFKAAEQRAQAIIDTGVSRSGTLILFGPVAFLLLVAGFIFAIVAIAVIPDDWPVGPLPFEAFLLWGGAGLAWPVMCLTALTFATRAIETAAAYVYVVDGRKPVFFSKHAMSGMVPALPEAPLSASNCLVCGYHVASGQQVCPECGSSQGAQQDSPG